MDKKEITEEKRLARIAYQLKWRAANRDKYNENQNRYTKEWYQRNKETVCAKHRENHKNKKQQSITEDCENFGAIKK
jgi:hypothetical protein